MALQGTLDTFALPDVLRLLATTAKTGRLRIDGDRGHGSVWLRDGTVMAATADRAVDDAPAEEVIFELLRFDEGAFAFEADALSPDGEQPEDVEILLRNASSLLSEWNELVSVVPSLDHRVRLVDSLPGGEVTIDARRWPSLVAVASGRTVREVASSLALSELAATRTVRDLVDIGVAELEEPSEEEPPPPPSRDDVPPHEMARRSPFSTLGSGETLATSVPPRPDNTGEMQRLGWLQSPERPSGPHTAVPDGLAPSSSGDRGSSDRGPGGPGNGMGPPSPSGPGLPSRGGRSGTGKRPGSGSARPSSGSRSSGGSGRSSSGRSGPGKRPSPTSSGRSGAGAGATGSASGSGRDPGGEPRRPAASGGPANGERSSRLGKGRPSGSTRRNGPGAPDPAGGPPTMPDNGPLSMPPMSPAAFDAGPLGPSPLPADTGQIRPVSPNSLPPDLQWAVDDDSAAMPPPAGPPRGPGMGGRGNGGPALGGPPLGNTPVDPNKIAPHVAAMSPEGRAAVQGAVGNTGGSSSGLGPGDELAHRGQLLNFLSSVRP